MISEDILSFLNKCGLDLDFCRGQGYDGAGNMAGKVQGAAVRIQRRYPKAIYVHCGAHLLNLAIASSCSIQDISNMMDHMKAVTKVCNSHPKHSDLLCNKIKEKLLSARHSCLIDVCRTRWVARLDALDVFVEIYSALVASLEQMKNNRDRSWAPEMVRTAYNLFNGVVSFEFIITLIVVCRLLGMTRPLTKQLQSPVLDALSAIEKVTLLFATLKRACTDINEMHDE